MNNELWHHSNGAWIRSEVWACMAPANIAFTVLGLVYGEGDFKNVLLG